MSSVLVAADNHYYRDTEGAVFVESVFNYDFYKRYLSVFDKVYAVGRVTQVASAPAGKKRADGPGVEFLDLEPGRGLKGFLQTGMANKRLIRDYLEKADCIIARVPGVVANMVVDECNRANKQYSVEVVVDPWEYFAPDVRGGIVNWVVRRKWTSDLKKTCMKARGVSYVTEHYLQERYPCSAMKNIPGYFTEHYSSVDLPDDSFSKERIYKHKDSIVVAHAANNFDGNSKGHYTLFDAIRDAVSRGGDVRAICIGDGPSMGEYRQYVDKIGITDRVEFTGKLADGSQVRRCMAKADAFVFPTRAEGLPRVLLEAMAEGMPCLSTPVCGIPEVLPEDCLFDPGDARGFATGILQMLDDPALMTQRSSDNLRTAKQYSASILNARRKAFYEQVLSVKGDRGL